MNDEKRTYRVKAGQVWGPGNRYCEGDVVELTEYEAAGFLDKLELVSALPLSDPDATPDDAPEPGDIAGDEDAAAGNPPDDDGAPAPAAKKGKRK